MERKPILTPGTLAPPDHILDAPCSCSLCSAIDKAMSKIRQAAEPLLSNHSQEDAAEERLKMPVRLVSSAEIESAEITIAVDPAAPGADASAAIVTRGGAVVETVVHRRRTAESLREEVGTIESVHTVRLSGDSLDVLRQLADALRAELRAADWSYIVRVGTVQFDRPVPGSKVLVEVVAELEP